MSDSYELIKNICMVAFMGFLVYFIFKSMGKLEQFREGLKNSGSGTKNNKNTNTTKTNTPSINTTKTPSTNTTKTNTTKTNTTNTNTTSDVNNGIAGNADSYASAINAQTVKIQDTLLVSKYRSDYENVIINMHDLMNNLMLSTVLNINHEDPTNDLGTIISLNETCNALNNVMKFLDKQ